MKKPRCIWKRGLAQIGQVQAIVITASLAMTLAASAAEPSKAKVAITSLADTKVALQKLDNQLGATVGSLLKVKESAGDAAALPKAYELFSQNFADLEAQSDAVRAQGTAAKARATEHYEAWQKELISLQRQDLREKAQERFSETKKQFDKIITLADQSKASFAPYVADLKDIKVYLGADLTKDSLDSLSNTIWKIGNKLRSVQGDLEDVIKQVDKTIRMMPKA